MAQLFDRQAYAVSYDAGPVARDAWKRAVYLYPPKHFSVEVLPPETKGGACAYGMRICPTQEDGHSNSPDVSHSEYEIWRRWEECLWFQDCFESEYERMSRAKRKRLAAGKGVKKNGLYTQKDRAASFESLPPGPDPQSVAKNIHDYVPKLTKKGVLFRLNQATIDQRFQELQACMEGFFQEGAPMLIQELRESQQVADFFGYWRRDFNFAVEQQQGKLFEKQASRSSISSSVFSTYFPSSPDFTSTEATLVNPPSGKSHMSHAKASTTSTVEFNFTSSGHSSIDNDFYLRSGSDGSTSSPLGPPSPSSTSYGAPSPYIFPHDIPIVFDHNPMEPLPENDEPIASLSEIDVTHDGKSVSPVWRDCNTSGDRLDSRNVQPASFDANEEVSADRSRNRLSWKSTLSGTSIDPASYLAELETDFTLPKSPLALYEFPRGSVTSLASFMTNSSADAIIPLLPEGDHKRSFSADSTRTMTLSDTETTLPNPDEDLDSYFDATFGRPATPASDSCPLSLPETPVDDLEFPLFMSSFSSDSNSRTVSRSLTLRDFTSREKSNVSEDGSIFVKVVHDMSIILLRLQRSISFVELRAKVYDKFVQQEGVPLSTSFALAFLPATPIDYSKPRPRSSSMSAVGRPDIAHMRFISSEHEWQHVIASTGRGKLTLRAIGDQGI
ncbi:hypothetical protein PILCRDRAFT_465649 [Piloderma croceum F 1598]|uniref:PX domain-containing protein n=1 Tax=Piloderma croceum (strain F 1598) TaxID=765440 RepID=A0A0C3FS06_PILCF|nr:hypothetical protein PILCRDRAFT_465649 [Piloderma croceum F 1598]